MLGELGIFILHKNEQGDILLLVLSLTYPCTIIRVSEEKQYATDKWLPFMIHKNIPKLDE